MASDSFFTQGSAHRVCQDYATHGPGYAVLSDGCSSAPHSDFGARLLTRAAVETMDRGIDFGSNVFYHRIMGLALGYCQALNLPLDCLFATLSIVRQKENKIQVTMRGDGSVAVKQRNGKIYVCTLDFPQTKYGSAPYFLRYDLNLADKDEYKKQVGHQYIMFEYVLDPQTGASVQTEHVCEIDFERADMFRMEFDIADVEAVGVMSDGVGNFMMPNDTATTKQTAKVPNWKIISEVMGFKGYVGEFVQRRCKMAFKQFDKSCWKPFDDFSIAVVSAEPVTELGKFCDALKQQGEPGKFVEE